MISSTINDKLNCYEIKPKFINNLDLKSQKHSSDITKHNSLISIPPKSSPHKGSDLQISSPHLANVKDSFLMTNKNDHSKEIVNSNSLDSNKVDDPENSTNNNTLKLLNKSIIAPEVVNNNTENSQ